MDIKSPRRNARTPIRSVPQNARDISTPKQTRTVEEITLSLMQARRTPIRSLNTSSVSISNRSISKQENLPVKRCFSQEVLDLSRRQIIMGKKSKSEISHVPPKRIKMGDFIYTPNSPNSKCHNNSLSKCSSEKYDTRKTELNTRPPLPQRRLALAPLQNNNPNPKKREKDGVGNQVAKPTTFVNDKEVQKRAVSHFLVTVENFPLEMWRENNFDCRILREIIFRSKGRIVPVKTTRKDGRLWIELNHPNDPNFFANVPPKVDDVKLVDFLKFPFGFSFRILAGVVKWVVGK